MPESSVDSYINAQPETILSKDQFWQVENSDRYEKAMKAAALNSKMGFLGPGVKLDIKPSNYNSLGYRINKFFGVGPESKFESDYDNYVNNVNNHNEWIASQSARQWDKMMEDTKVQRTLKDYERAGLNPYLLLNNGSISSGSSVTSTKSDYKTSNKGKEQSQSGRNIALLLLALARVAAAFM